MTSPHCLDGSRRRIPTDPDRAPHCGYVRTVIRTGGDGRQIDGGGSRCAVPCACYAGSDGAASVAVYGSRVKSNTSRLRCSAARSSFLPPLRRCTFARNGQAASLSASDGELRRGFAIAGRTQSSALDAALSSSQRGESRCGGSKQPLDPHRLHPSVNRASSVGPRSRYGPRDLPRLVAHGRRSGDNMARYFSNEAGSLMTSLGCS